MPIARNADGPPITGKAFARTINRSGIEDIASTSPEPGFINPVLDYDWSARFDPNDVTGIPDHVLLGTYLGWNITAGGERPFHQGKLCSYAGGMIPCTKTRAERVANSDPRLSLEERYSDHAGYVAAVKKAAAQAVATGYLLAVDADRLIAEAQKSQVLK